MAPLVGHGMWFGSRLNSYLAFVVNSDSNTVQPFSYNASTGALTAGTAVATGSVPIGVAVDTTNHFVFVTNESSNTVQPFSYNASTGALTAGTAVATGSNPYGVAVAYS